MNCKCGHSKESHIYNEGACRPGFVCECDKYKTVSSMSNGVNENMSITKSIQELSIKLAKEIEFSLIEQLVGLVNLGIIEVSYRPQRESFNSERTEITLESAVGVRFSGKEKIIELQSEVKKLKDDLRWALGFLRTELDCTLHEDEQDAESIIHTMRIRHNLEQEK